MRVPYGLLYPSRDVAEMGAGFRTPPRQGNVLAMMKPLRWPCPATIPAMEVGRHFVAPSPHRNAGHGGGYDHTPWSSHSPGHGDRTPDHSAPKSAVKVALATTRRLLAVPVVEAAPNPTRQLTAVPAI